MSNVAGVMSNGIIKRIRGKSQQNIDLLKKKHVHWDLNAYSLISDCYMLHSVIQEKSNISNFNFEKQIKISIF